MDHVTGTQALALLIRDWVGGPAFHVPGEGILELVDALEGAEVPLISCRHEAGAAVAAQRLGGSALAVIEAPSDGPASDGAVLPARRRLALG